MLEFNQVCIPGKQPCFTGSVQALMCYSGKQKSEIVTRYIDVEEIDVTVKVSTNVIINEAKCYIKLLRKALRKQSRVLQILFSRCLI